MTYKQISDVSQVPNMVEVVPESYVPNGNDNIYHQETTMYQQSEPAINQDAPTYIPNTITQWNYQVNTVQNQSSTMMDEELQRKISTVSTGSNFSSLSSDSVQGLVLQDIQHHAIIHEENAIQNNQIAYIQSQEVINSNQTENIKYCKAQSPSNETYLPTVQPYSENQLCPNYNNQVILPEETNMGEEKFVDIVETSGSTNIVESDVKQNLRYTYIFNLYYIFI